MTGAAALIRGGRPILKVVRDEAEPDEDALVELWAALAVDRERLAVRDCDRSWVAENVADDVLAERYLHILEGVTAQG